MCCSRFPIPHNRENSSGSGDQGGDSLPNGPSSSLASSSSPRPARHPRPLPGPGLGDFFVGFLVLGILGILLPDILAPGVPGARYSFPGLGYSIPVLEVSLPR